MSTITPAQPATPAGAAPAAPSAVPPATPPAAAPAAPPAAPAAVTPAQPQAAVGGTTPVADPATPATPPATPAPVLVTDVSQLAVPEGFPVDDAKAIAALAKTHQWTQEEAQAALDAAHTHNVEQRAAMSGRLQADQTFGGARLPQTQQHVQRVMDRFLPATTPLGAELRSVMNKTGYGDFLPLVALIASIGQTMGEDGMVVRDPTQTGAVVDPVARLYGKPAS